MRTISAPHTVLFPCVPAGDYRSMSVRLLRSLSVGVNLGIEIATGKMPATDSKALTPMAIELTGVELYCALRTMRKRRDEIDYSLGLMLARYADSMDEAAFAGIRALYADRGTIETVLGKLYEEAISRRYRKAIE